MNQQEITEGNKLIAEFMGEETRINSKGEWRCKNSNLWSLWLNAIDLDYHFSWDWLMPVVKKIEEMGFNVTMRGISCSVSRLCKDETIVQLVLGDRSQKMDLVYCVVVEFIKWYTQQK